MSDRRMKNSKGSETSNFSLKCIRIVQKCTTELRRILSSIESHESATFLVKHQTAMIQACGKNLQTALTSCNLYRIPFAEEAYYLTQLTKIERGISQIFDAVASLECRKFSAHLGNNKQADDLFGMLETTFDSFVGPLLHVFNSFNVRCLLFQCDALNLYLLDQLDSAALRKKLCLFTLSSQQNPTITSQQPEEYEDSCSDSEDLKSTNESTHKAIQQTNTSTKKPMKFDELLDYYLKREATLLGEPHGSLAELAILIDYLSEEEPSRYESTFYSYYHTLFEESVSDKISVVLRHTRSFRSLNYHVKGVFYDSEIMSLPCEEILRLLSEAKTFEFSDLRLKLIKSSFTSSVQLPLQLPINDSVIVSRQTEYSSTNYSTPPSQLNSAAPSSSQLVSSAFSGSSKLQVGQFVFFCPHADNLMADVPPTYDFSQCRCRFLKTASREKPLETIIEDTAEVMETLVTECDADKDGDADDVRQIGSCDGTDSHTGSYHDSDGALESGDQLESLEEKTLRKRTMIFGRAAQNCLSKIDFSFGSHENLISRQQFQITYEPFSNEYNVQCLSQSSLTQLVIDEVGFELTEGSIFVVQDMIAFQVVALRSIQTRHRLETKQNPIEDSQDKQAGPSISEIAHKLSRQFTANTPSKKEIKQEQLASANETDPINEGDVTPNDRKFQKLFKKSGSSNRISYRGTTMLGDTTPNQAQAGSSRGIADFESDGEGSDENSNSGNSEDNMNSDSETSDAGSSNKQMLTSIQLHNIANSAEQPGSLLKPNRKSVNTPIAAYPKSSVTESQSLTEAFLQPAVPVDSSAGDEECTMDYKKSAQIDDEKMINAIASMNMGSSTTSPQMHNSTQFMLSSMTTSAHLNGPKSAYTKTAMTTIFDYEEENKKEEPFLQLRVLWSKVQTEKEDYLFQYDPNKPKSTDENGAKEGEEIGQSEDKEQQMIIHIGSDNKSNQIHILDTTNAIKSHAHCSIAYQDNGWTIFSQHGQLDSYTGIALKKAEEIENGLISKKILIEKGYNILVSGYIFECNL